MHPGGVGRVVLAAGLLVAALTLVVVATSNPPSGFADIGDAGWLADVMVGTFAVGAVVAIVVVPAFVVLAVRNPEKVTWHKPPKRSRLAWVLAPLLPMIAFIGFSVLHRSDSQEPAAETLFGQLGNDLASQGVDDREARPTNWTVVGITVVGIFALGTAGAFAVRRHLLEVDEDLSEEMALSEPISFSGAVQASLDALDDEPDHRLAVIAAYARMEQLFAEAGLPRQPAETAREHVDRALGWLGASPDVVAVLAQGFEEARFSTREIGPEARADAIRALTRLREELTPTLRPVGAGPPDPSVAP